MTALTTTRTTPPAADAALARLLRADGLSTAAVGVAVLAATAGWADQLWGQGVPTWLPVLAGAVCAVAGAELVLAARWSGRRLRLVGTVCAELALLVAAACAVTAVAADLPAPGVELLAVVGVVSAGFGIAELRALARTSR